MCILFIHQNVADNSSDYSLIIASNRDEYYSRPTKKMAPWCEIPTVIGGRDLKSGYEGGTWLALSLTQNILGVLLNIPNDHPKPNANGRGRIVTDYVKSELPFTDYIETIKQYAEACNNFIVISVGLRDSTIQSYTNSTGKIDKWTDKCVGFGNSQPDNPLKKVTVGKNTLEEICAKYNKITKKSELLAEITKLLKDEERHLPDPVLESRRPEIYKELSSIFVSIPTHGYGTRTHTIILVTKSGNVDVIETTLQTPISEEDPQWTASQFNFNLNEYGERK